MKSRKLTPISHIVMMGDSLSDRGTMNNRYLLGCIPMSWLSGLAQKSPSGRFTNGFTWSDAFSAKIISKFIIDDFTKNALYKRKEHQNSPDVADRILNKRPIQEATPKWDYTDTADAVITRDRKIIDTINYGYHLDDNLRVKYQGLDFVRHYVEGGLTAHDYSWMPSTSLSRFFSRLILSTLSSQREQLFYDDKTRAITMKQKAETLVLEWSGANDLITVNEKPSKSEVDDAIRARMDNATQLIKNGYRHIVLLNLPNLAFTPRYLKKSEQEQADAKYYSDYFNQQLAKKYKKLQQDYPYCSLQIFDVNSLFSKLHKYPEKYGIEAAKMNQTYVDSVDFSINPNGTSPSSGYMFFDDVHPTADVHANLASKIYDKCKNNYLFSKPKVEAVNAQEEHIVVDEAGLLACFRRKYEKTLAKNQAGFFGAFCSSNLQYKTASLEDILRHAFFEGGRRTRNIITELQWIDEAGNICLNIPVLKNAMQNVTVAASLQGAQY